MIEADSMDAVKVQTTKKKHQGEEKVEKRPVKVDVLQEKKMSRGKQKVGNQ